MIFVGIMMGCQISNWSPIWTAEIILHRIWTAEIDVKLKSREPKSEVPINSEDLKIPVRIEILETVSRSRRSSSSSSSPRAHFRERFLWKDFAVCVFSPPPPPALLRAFECVFLVLGVARCRRSGFSSFISLCCPRFSNSFELFFFSFFCLCSCCWSGFSSGLFTLQVGPSVGRYVHRVFFSMKLVRKRRRRKEQKERRQL